MIYCIVCHCYDYIREGNTRISHNFATLVPITKQKNVQGAYFEILYFFADIAIKTSCLYSLETLNNNNNLYI